MMRWVLYLALIPLGSCLIGVGDVESDSAGGKGGSAASDASTDGSSGTGGTIASGGTAGTGSGGSAGQPSGGGGSAGGVTSEGGGVGGSTGTLIFSDDFTTDLAKWKSYGDGVWAVEKLMAYQSAPTATNGTLYAVGVNVIDARVVVKGTLDKPGMKGASMEILMRYDVQADSFLHCNWQPDTPSIVLKAYSPSAGPKILLQKMVTLPVGFMPEAPVTMEMTAIGDQLSCRVQEVPGADITSTFAGTGGTVGIKTWNMSAFFDDFQLYQL